MIPCRIDRTLDHLTPDPDFSEIQHTGSVFVRISKNHQIFRFIRRMYILIGGHYKKKKKLKNHHQILMVRVIIKSVLDYFSLSSLQT